ncbi:MAG: hypothetical protein ACF8NJ_03885 [Phycisphaerales bacterium JB038]
MSNSKVILAGSVAALFIFTAGAGAGEVEGTVDVNWRFDADDVAAMWGHYTLDAWSNAYCTCNGADPDEDHAAGNWPVAAGLAVQDVLAVSWVAHSYADAEASVSATVPVPHGGANQLFMTVTHEIAGVSDPEHCPGKAYSDAWRKASSLADIEGATVTGSTLKANRNGAHVRYHKHGSAGSIYYLYEDYYRDPVSLVLREVDTGAVWEETIWDMTIESAGALAASAWLFSSDEGVVLEVGRDDQDDIGSTVTIAGQSTSDWLLNPYGEFSATLGPGGFSATGVWADLPWDLLYDGPDVIRATLPAVYLPTEQNFEYEVPDSLLTEDFLYDQALNLWDEQQGLAVLPAPGTFVLLAFASSALRRRAR